MSKLAAICAKLNGGATIPQNGVASLFDAPNDDNGDIRTAGNSTNTRLSSTSISDGKVKYSATSPSQSDMYSEKIGVLKRKSIMPQSAGASKRKRQRPTSLHSDNTESGSALASSTIEANQNSSVTSDDNQSMDGSEHSLHIDLPDETETTNTTEQQKSEDSGSYNPFKQYSKQALEAKQVALLGAGVLAMTPGDVINNIMASQSLAALAQHASSMKTDNMISYKGVASPASVSGDSLNDSTSRVTLPAKHNVNKQKKDIDYVQYLKRYSGGNECGSAYCIGMNYKDHYHCVDCKSKIFVKKEEMIRHYKWHKKRDDSLQHGFMRYSPFDDCSSRFGPCAHNKKQTHYHCVQTGCNKVYVSTSDVQMHANYHRKASAIIMEGFQRFRATEDCGTPSCDFYSQRTTHFHCRRTGCNFTFKNKADMEKHKTYHQKDEILAKDGFKKYMKYEHCPYPGCAYSKLSNHIHCMRPGCVYVLHSTSQLYPHKRKHEKKDMDHSFPKYEPIAPNPHVPASTSAAITIPSSALTSASSSSSTELISSVAKGISAASSTTASDLLSTVARISQGLIQPVSNHEAMPSSSSSMACSPATQVSPTSKLTNASSEVSGGIADDGECDSKSSDDLTSDQLCDKSLNLTPGRVLAPAAMNWKTEKSKRLNEHAKSMMGHFKISSNNTGADGGATTQLKTEKSANNNNSQTELWKKYLTRYTANDPCNPRCWLLYKDHYHCNVENCFNAFKNKDGVRDHARLHDNQEKISEQLFMEYLDNQPCNVDGCEYSNKKLHFHCNWAGCKKSIPHDENVFARLDHFQEHELATRITQASARRNVASSISPKFAPKRRGRPPKQAHTLANIDFSSGAKPEIKPKGQHPNYNKYDLVEQCDDELCAFRQEEHYHCTKPRCHSVTNRLDVIDLHSHNFHNFVKIPENYAYFDRNVNCRNPSCSHNRNSSHYHCLRPGCDHSFIRHATVALHDKKHSDGEYDRTVSGGGTIPILPKPNTSISGKIEKSESQVEPALADQLRRLAEVAMQNQSMKVSESINQNLLDSKVTNQKTIKATGTFFPQTGITTADKNASPTDDSSGASSSFEESPTELKPAVKTESRNCEELPVLSQSASSASHQMAAMLSLLNQMLVMQKKPSQQQTAASAVDDNDTWQKMLGRMYASPQVPCGNVFCKKKQVEHYHCLDCGTAFNKTHESRLRTHVSKHAKYSSSGSPTPTELASNPVAQSYGETSTSSSKSVPSSSASLTNMLNAFVQQQAALLNNTGLSSLESSTPCHEVAVADSSTEERASTSASNIQDMMMQALQLQMVSGNKKTNQQSQNSPINNNESMPEGYRKFFKYEDCGYTKCSHSRTSAHYHCIRDDCGYSVNEESRLAQHTQRHDKLDKIMGDDFKLYRMNADCGRSDCEFTNRSAHFHCLLCPYICTDASKIMPHRKNHSDTTPNFHENDELNGDSILDSN